MTKHVCTHCKATFTNLQSLDRHRLPAGTYKKRCHINPQYFSVLEDGSYSHTGYFIKPLDVEPEVIDT